MRLTRDEVFLLIDRFDEWAHAHAGQDVTVRCTNGLFSVTVLGPVIRQGRTILSPNARPLLPPAIGTSIEGQPLVPQPRRCIDCNDLVSLCECN